MFLSIMTPDGFIAYFMGPWIGQCNDAWILHESGLLEQLQNLMPLDQSNGPVFALFADLIFPHHHMCKRDLLIHHLIAQRLFSTPLCLKIR
jgi:hypothetical protein